MHTRIHVIHTMYNVNNWYCVVLLPIFMRYVNKKCSVYWSDNVSHLKQKVSPLSMLKVLHVYTKLTLSKLYFSLALYCNSYLSKVDSLLCDGVKGINLVKNGNKIQLNVSSWTLFTKLHFCLHVRSKCPYPYTSLRKWTMCENVWECVWMCKMHNKPVSFTQ